MPNMGQRKTQMELIESNHAQQVTFCKRRTGLFMKASERCTLSAVILYSIFGKALSFGHRSVNSLFNKLNKHNGAALDDSDLDDSEDDVGQGPSTLQDLNKLRSDLLQRAQLGEKRAREIKQKLMEKPTPDELRKIMRAIVQVQEKVRGDKEKLLAQLPLPFRPWTVADPAGLADPVKLRKSSLKFQFRP